MSKILTYGGYALTVGNHAVGAEIYKIPLPANTLRVKFTEGVTPSFYKGTGTQVSASPNIWDVTYNNSDWSQMFYNVSDLLEVIAAGDTSSVTNMKQLFYYCTSLTNVIWFDTSAVTDMTEMFEKCAITTVPLYDTSSVTNMSSMFQECTSLQNVPLFDTSAVTDMSWMFNKCTSLASIPIFDTSSVSTMLSMFANCTALTHAPALNTSTVTNLAYMFSGCSALKAVPLYDTSSAVYMSGMFRECRYVESGAFDLYWQAAYQTVPPTSYSQCFRACGSSTQTGAAELSRIPASWK